MRIHKFRQVISFLLFPVVFIVLNVYSPRLHCQEWQPAEQLVSVPGQMCKHPAISVYNNHVYVVWEDLRDGVSAQAYLRKSNNYGEGFQPGIRLSDADDIEVSYCRVVCWEDQVHVVWMGEDAASDNQIYYCRSQDGGENFSATIQITSASSESFTPDIAIYENSVHIVWVDLKDLPSAIRVYYMRSTDGGSTWSPETPLGEMMKEGYTPRIAADGQSLYVSWINLNVPPTGSDIFFRKSVDNGENWEAVKALYNTSTTIILPHNDLCVSDGNINLAWEDYRNGTSFQVYHGRSINEGLTFEGENCLNTGTSEFHDPEIAAFSEFVYCSWSNTSKQIEYRRSVNHGQDWEPTIVISEPAEKSSAPDIAAFNDNVYAVWEQTNASGFTEIYFRRTTSDFSVEEIPGGDNSRPVLYQNQPNPCTENTTFRFFLPHPASASLCIYNSAGMLTDKTVPTSYSSGEHKISWNISHLKTGIYYYRLLIDGKHASEPMKKMLIQ